MSQETVLVEEVFLEPKVESDSPQTLPFVGIEVKYDVNRVRLLGRLVRKQKGVGEFSSEEARAFILLYGKELQDRLDQTVRQFLEEKL